MTLIKETQIFLANEIFRLNEQYTKSLTLDLYKRHLKLKSEFDLLSTNEIEGLLRSTRRECFLRRWGEVQESIGQSAAWVLVKTNYKWSSSG